MVLVELAIKNIYSQAQSGAYALILNEVEGQNINYHWSIWTSLSQWG